eukprot:TRINITY_DN2787_c0_g1_i1.p1 TRINITY_DN2787_c0_g1~~TRINITY_DN2787_c0_g1_i1.p1  ORF type:complete len:123 (+),score=35.00 TRINITY_DN2787_c0_g1_i1:61-429(+)
MNQKLLFVTHEDMVGLPSMSGETIIVIKAPSGTILDAKITPSETNPNERNYQILLRNPNTQPIDVYLLNKEEAPPPHNPMGGEETLLSSGDFGVVGPDFSEGITDYYVDEPISSTIDSFAPK